MSNQKDTISEYIYSQLNSGIHPDEIAQQLKGAGWQQSAITEAFNKVQSAVKQTSAAKQSPATSEQPAGQPIPNTTNYEPMGKKRGRIKTAWLLLKQSLKVLNSNKQLMRYPTMSVILTLLIAIIFGILFLLGGDKLFYVGQDVFGDQELVLTPLGTGVALIYYVISAFIVFIYSAGLAAHVLDIFRGKSEEYAHYMKRAWSKANVIFVYSVINSIVGVLLNMLERNRIAGYFISRFLGLLWSLANLFTIPVIVENDISAVGAIKHSTKLFKARWGENIAARVGFGGITFLVYLFALIPLSFLLIFIGVFLGPIGILLSVVLLFILTIAFAVIMNTASQVLSVSLYFYTQYQQIPANFSPELLNAVFVANKKAKKKTA